MGAYAILVQAIVDHLAGIEAAFDIQTCTHQFTNFKIIRRATALSVHGDAMYK